MLERGPAAKYAAPAFYRHYNDFDVYIEDTAVGYEKIFASLLKRAISTRFSLSRVFPLGPRGNVIDAAKLEKQSTSKRRSVFIIDGDLHLLCGEKLEIPNNVIVLPRYCIENFLFDEDALISLMDEEDPEAPKDVLKAKLDFDGWIERSKIGLRKIFTAFAAAKKLGSGIPTIARGSKCVCASYDAEIDITKATAIYEEIYQSLATTYGVVVLEYVLSTIEEKVKSDQCYVSTYVSGKDFVLPLIVQRVRAITRTKAPNINLKLRLSKSCDVSSMKSVVEQIATIIECADIIPEN